MLKKKKKSLLNYHLSLYSPPLSVRTIRQCTMTKECDIFSLKVQSNMLNRHCHGDALNQRFAISPRTGVLPVSH